MLREIIKFHICVIVSRIFFSLSHNRDIDRCSLSSSPYDVVHISQFPLYDDH